MRNCYTTVVGFLFSLLLFTSCEHTHQAEPESGFTAKDETVQCKAVLQKHLDAVSNKDLAGLKSTMSPDNKMELILPGTEIISSVDSFMAFHEAWFQDTSWTFETSIKQMEVGTKNSFAITEIVYREPERDGLPYFNRMIVTYGLEKIDSTWYVIMDHASSVEKSTDGSGE